MSEIYRDISRLREERFLAVLIDPEKEVLDELALKIQKINQSKTTHIFVGGSTDPESKTKTVIKEIKKHTQLPVIIFPGDVNQIAHTADAILFLSLISGRNPEYLIEKQVNAVPELLKSDLEVIPTGYILVESGSQSAVERVSKTAPLPISDVDLIVNTAKAGELLGMKLIYLEAGSGAANPVPRHIIRAVKNQLKIPLIVGGGIRTNAQLEAAYAAGANLVVVGTAFEQDQGIFENQLKKEIILNK